MTRFIVVSALLILLMFSFAPGVANSAQPFPPTNTPRAHVEAVLIPSLTPAPCPPEERYQVTVNGQLYNVDMKAVCR